MIREQSSDSVQRGAVELARIVGAHDAYGHLFVTLDDGTFWEIGEGLHVPRAARRWVAHRLAALTLRIPRSGSFLPPG